MFNTIVIGSSFIYIARAKKCSDSVIYFLSDSVDKQREFWIGSGLRMLGHFSLARNLDFKTLYKENALL